MNGCPMTDPLNDLLEEVMALRRRYQRHLKLRWRSAMIETLESEGVLVGPLLGEESIRALYLTTTRARELLHRAYTLIDEELDNYANQDQSHQPRRQDA